MAPDISSSKSVNKLIILYYKSINSQDNTDKQVISKTDMTGKTTQKDYYTDMDRTTQQNHIEIKTNNNHQ